MTTLTTHVNGHAPAPAPWIATEPARAAHAEQRDDAVRPIVGPLRTAAIMVGTAVAALGLLGFVNSFHRVDTSAQPSFHALAWTVPTGIDLGIFIFSALDILLAILNMRIVWLRLIPWALTAVTIQLNIADQPNQPVLTGFDKLAHGVLPAMWALSVEVGAHVVRKRAHLTSAKRMDRVRVSRWILAPLPTLGLWRRMVLWEERSYPAALAREKARVLAKTHLQDTYGRAWRFTAPRRERALYRLGDLVPTTVADIVSAGPSGTGPQTGPQTGAQTVRTESADRPASKRAPAGGRSARTKQTGPRAKSGPSARRTADHGADTSVGIADLIPLGEQVAATITATDARLTRAALVAGLREHGTSVSNERAGALLTHLRTTTPARTEQTEQTSAEEVA